MIELESIVRPTLPTDFRPPVNTLVLVPVIIDDDDTVVWGGAGDSVFQLKFLGAPTQIKFVSTEESRVFDTVRVKDPDNDENHLDLEVMTQYSGRNKTDDSRISISLARVQPAQDVEILSRNNVRTNTTTPATP